MPTTACIDTTPRTFGRPNLGPLASDATETLLVRLRRDNVGLEKLLTALETDELRMPRPSPGLSAHE